MTPKKYYDNNSIPVEQGYVFVLLMEEAKDVYNGYIKPAANSLGLKCESFLDLNNPGDAILDILERIKKAEILIFDITHFSSNVMLELGVALAIKDEDKIIIIREAGDNEFQKELPFNIYQNRVSHNYEKKALNDLRDKLVDVMKDIKRRGSVRDNPIKSHEVRKLMASSLEAIAKKDWITAEVLFEKMNDTEAENWYILNQWGIMYRRKNDFEIALSKFKEALEYTNYEEEQAYIYIENGLLYQSNRNPNQAEEWFRKAEKADVKNKYLYIVWAKLYEELGEYRKAQNKINFILDELDPNDQECKLRYDFYHQKNTDQAFSMSFDEFKKKREKSITRGPSGKQHNPPPRPPRPNDNQKGIPWDITREELENSYMDKEVEGIVNGTNSRLGVFVTLSRDFSGLIFRGHLEPDYESKFFKNQRLTVRITGVSVNKKSGRVEIPLALVKK